MDGLTLIGRVGRDIVRQGLDRSMRDAGVSRFVLHGLESEEIATIVLAVQEDASLCQRLDICLPRYEFGAVPGIAPEHLTDVNTTDLRHAECDKEGRLLVLLDESQAQSLSQVEAVDAASLLSVGQLDLWRGYSGAASELAEDGQFQWHAAIRALVELDRVSMRQFADYLVAVAQQLQAGSPLTAALGHALPNLRLPRFDGLFDDIAPARRGHFSQWRQRLVSHWKRDCFIYKRDTGQTPFSPTRLREKLVAMADALGEDVYAVLAAYVEAPPGSGTASFAPFELDWTDVRPFFEEAQRADAKSIGSETRAFYKLAREDRLTDGEWRYLDELADDRGRNPEMDDRDAEFYGAHVAEIRQDARLASLWDRFIFGPEVPCTDFVDGLLTCVRRLYRPRATGRQMLVVEAVEDEKRAFLSLNEDICSLFEARYRGLEAALEGLVSFKRVLAFRHGSFAEEVSSRRRAAQSSARKARQLRFKVRMEEDGASGASVRLVWEASLDAVGIGLPGDLARLLDNKTGTPLIRCSAGYRRQRTRASQAGINLADLSGLDPAAQRNRGSFVPASSRCESLALAWRRTLGDARKANAIDSDAADQLTQAFKGFEESYTKALTEWSTLGARSELLAAQVTAYGSLLDAVCSLAGQQPMVVEGLLRPLFEIGVAPINGVASGRPSVILCPWHPLRLETQHARLAKFQRALTQLFAPNAPEFADGGALFFDELARNLRDPARPDVTMTWPSAQGVLVSEVDALHDYSLLEPPVTRAGASAQSNENVLPTARQIADLAQDYLKLQPHERDNLSIVLFNCDAAALPQAVVDAVRKDAERNDEEAMCQVVLRHTDGDQLRAVYQQLVQRELQQDGLHASEAARDFMSRLRISILVNEQRPSQNGEGPPFDIVFCHDVISRQAELGWSDIPRIIRPAIDIDPAQWSRRKPIGRFDRDAVLHLVCPAQTEAGWRYLDAIAALAEPSLALAARAKDQCRVPDRRTVLQSDITRQVIDETHRLGAWVVNFDDLLDRRQLINSGISVIRYKHASCGDRSLIISSKASDTLLRATLCNRLRGLDASYDTQAAAEMATRLIGDANDVSGDIVLRAARRGTSAGELIGVVLSKYLVNQELGARPKAWLFLDDYASWLGQAEGRMADLLCLAPSIGEDGERVLDVIVTEAKFVKATNAGEKADHSQVQLKATLRRFERALTGRALPADSMIWRARLAEMLQDGLRDAAGVDQGWRTAIRDGECKIRVAGYSHVFTHGFGDAELTSSDQMTGVEGTASGYQERYSPASVREIVRTYAERRDPTPFRRSLGAVVAGDEPVAAAPPSASVPALPLEPVVEQAVDAAAIADAVSAVSPTPVKPLDAMDEAPMGFRALLRKWAREVPTEATDALWLADTAQRCRAALMRYGMSARLEQQILTPNAALLKFRGSDDLTVAKVESKRVELETTHGLELINVRAEPGFVVLSIKRPHRMTLELPAVWQDWDGGSNSANARLLIAIKEDDGSPMFLEPEPAPHTLVAGSTGSGKSILIQNIILGIAATNRPELAQIVLIDPKAGVDYFAFEDLPHLDGAIIDNEDEALERLDALVAEMQRRYTLFKAARVSNITAYNKAAAEPLPLIWLIHDEFADWMQIDTYRAGVEAAVTRLGVKARAAGIYLIFAAQRPDASVFPMQLRSNLGNRLILRVDSAGTSDLSLGIKNGGAERLLGKGHLAAIIGGGTNATYAQVPFLSTERLELLVAALARDLAKPTNQ